MSIRVYADTCVFDGVFDAGTVTAKWAAIPATFNLE